MTVLLNGEGAAYTVVRDAWSLACALSLGDITAGREDWVVRGCLRAIALATMGSLAKERLLTPAAEWVAALRCGSRAMCWRWINAPRDRCGKVRLAATAFLPSILGKS
jgi:hypothetical protein